jgi:hypothetical protein
MATTDCCRPSVAWDSFCQPIRTVGVSNVIASSDFGQMANGSPVAGFGRGLEQLLASGFTAEEIRTMVCDNPRRLVERAWCRPAARAAFERTSGMKQRHALTLVLLLAPVSRLSAQETQKKMNRLWWTAFAFGLLFTNLALVGELPRLEVFRTSAMAAAKHDEQSRYERTYF